MVVSGLTVATVGRVWQLSIGALMVLVGLALSRVSWSIAPLWLGRAMPPVAVVAVAVLCFTDPGATAMTACPMVMVVMWTGVALDAADLAIAVALSSAVLLVARWHVDGPAVAIPQGVIAVLLLACAGRRVVGSRWWPRRSRNWPGSPATTPTPSPAR